MKISQLIESSGRQRLGRHRQVLRRKLDCQTIIQAWLLTLRASPSRCWMRTIDSPPCPETLETEVWSTRDFEPSTPTCERGASNRSANSWLSNVAVNGAIGPACTNSQSPLFSMPGAGLEPARSFRSRGF